MCACVHLCVCVLRFSDATQQYGMSRWRWRIMRVQDKGARRQCGGGQESNCHQFQKKEKKLGAKTGSDDSLKNWEMLNIPAYTKNFNQYYLSFLTFGSGVTSVYSLGVSLLLLLLLLEFK